MIEQKELRIGNYVQFYRKIEDQDLSQASICSIFETDGDYYVKFEDGFCVNTERGIKPISLSEELILKCGFTIHDNTQSDKEYIKKYSSGRTVLNYNLVITKSCYKDSGEYRIVVVGRVSDCEICNIKYLHQLQNIYFALTGKELMVNL